jgi:hypothetical protein
MSSKLYSFCETKLQYKQFSRKIVVILAVAIFFAGVSSGLIIQLGMRKEKVSPEEYEELVLLIDEKENELLSPRAIYEYMKEVNIKYPEIVWSQIVQETGFCSQVSIENHNFFGMKKASCRPNVQTGVDLNHATYRNWKMSVLDYALWQASTGLWKVKSEQQYFAYLAEHYAADPSYATSVKNIRDNFESYLNQYEEKFKKGDLKNK